MAIGDVRMVECKIGNLDLTGKSQTYFDEINIVEDITSSYGPAGEIRVVDGVDARSNNNINGSYQQDVSIKFTDDLGKLVAFKLKQFEGTDVTDHSGDNSGSGKNTQYSIRCVSPELLNAQGNYMEKSWKDKTSKIAENVLKEGYKTDKKINVEETNEVRNWIASSELPSETLDKLNESHVSSQNKSSCFFTYQHQKQGTQEYNIKTVEELFKQSTIADITYSTTLDSTASTEEEKRNSAIWCNVDSNFFAGSRHLTKPSQQTFNLTTHKAVSDDPKTEKFTLPGKEVYKGQTTNHKVVPQRGIYSKVNEPSQPISPAEAATKRSEFLSHLAQNSAECEIIGNPDIHLGSMVNLKIPKRMDGASGFGGGESQFADKCLVVGIRHRIRPEGQSPRYTMVLKLVKASFSKTSGGTA
jgi:hypothetical protein